MFCWIINVWGSFKSFRQPYNTTHQFGDILKDSSTDQAVGLLSLP